MKYLYILLAILLIIPGFELCSQVSQEWIARYDANLEDYGSCIAVDNSQNIYVAGSVKTSSLSNHVDLAVLKYSKSGQLIWSRTFDGAASLAEEAADIVFSQSTSSIIVTGYTEYQNTWFDIVTIKYNLNGDSQWVKIYHHPLSQSNKSKKLAVDNSGNIYITGFTGNSHTDYLTIKYNSQGSLLWTATYTGIVSNSIDESRGISVSPDGNAYVTGGSSGNPSNLGILDIATIKYNANGVQQWITRYNGPVNKNDEPANLVIDSQENVYVAGKSQINANNSDYEYLVIKYSSNGAPQWNDHQNDVASSEALAIALDNQDYVYVTGYTTHPSQSSNFITVKYSPNGEILWMTQFNNYLNHWDIPKAIAVDNSYNVYVTGRGGGPNWLFSDYNTVKYNSNGVQQWAMNFNVIGEDSPADIVVDNENNVYVTGWSELNSADIVTIKYSSLVGIRPLSNEIPDEFSLYQNYPNPFNPSTKINFDLPKQSFTMLRVYDISGREMKTVVYESLNAGKYAAEFNASGLSSGIYFYRIVAGEFTDVRKMILVK